MTQSSRSHWDVILHSCTLIVVRHHIRHMSKTANYVMLVGALLLSSCAVSDAPSSQSFVPSLIEKSEAAPEESSPDEIWSFLIGDEVVFYIASECCDIPSTLYDKDGDVLCHPDGGLAGLGYGQCPRFYKNRSTGILVWRDPRLNKNE